MSKYARRVDANQSDIVDALRAVGCFVHDCSAIGDGFPDLLCARAGRLWLVEVKDGSKPPSERRLTPAQHEFHQLLLAAGVTVYVVKSVDEALATAYQERLSAAWLNGTTA